MAPSPNLNNLPVDALLTVSASYTSSLGAILLGCIFGSMLYALMLHQAYRYYRMYPGDRLVLKALVLAILLMETCHMVIWILAAYHYLVTDYFNLFDVILTHWTIKLSILVSTITVMFSHIFYAGRVYYIGPQSKYRLLVAAAVFVMLLYLGWTIAATIQFWRSTTIIDFTYSTWMVSIVYGLVLLCDLITTVALIFILRRSRTGVKRTDTVIDTLMLYTINTGLLTTIFGLLTFIFAVVSPDNAIYAGISIPGIKLYSNSVLATLNSRRALSERMTRGLEASSHEQERDTRPQAANTVLETWNVRQASVTWPDTMDSVRSLGTHEESAEPPSSGDAATKASLVDFQVEKVVKVEPTHIDAPAARPVSKDDTVMTRGIVLMDGEGLVTKHEEA